MSRECYYALSWPTLLADPPCPPCGGAVTHVWAGYHHGRNKATFGPDIFLCSAHASWKMDLRQMKRGLVLSLVPHMVNYAYGDAARQTLVD